MQLYRGLAAGGAGGFCDCVVARRGVVWTVNHFPLKAMQTRQRKTWPLSCALLLGVAKAVGGDQKDS